jgi:hypothetical protein
MDTKLARRPVLGVVLGLVLIALSAPAAQAKHGPDDHGVTSPASPHVVTTVRPAGFDFGDALLGGAVAIGCIALLAALAVLAHANRRRRVPEAGLAQAEPTAPHAR